jgi:hypothetical protein
MPMSADEAIRAIVDQIDLEHHNIAMMDARERRSRRAAAEAAIREAFAIADRARAELERLEAEHPVPLQQLANPAHALIVTLRRILGEEGSA